MDDEERLRIIKEQKEKMENNLNSESRKLAERRELIIWMFEKYKGFTPCESEIKADLEFLDKCEKRMTFKIFKIDDDMK